MYFQYGHTVLKMVSINRDTSHARNHQSEIRSIHINSLVLTRKFLPKDFNQDAGSHCNQYARLAAALCFIRSIHQR